MNLTDRTSRALAAALLGGALLVSFAVAPAASSAPADPDDDLAPQPPPCWQDGWCPPPTPCDPEVEDCGPEPCDPEVDECDDPGDEPRDEPDGDPDPGPGSPAPPAEPVVGNPAFTG